jgi:hypothetical protein
MRKLNEKKTATEWQIKTGFSKQKFADFGEKNNLNKKIKNL